MGDEKDREQDTELARQRGQDTAHQTAIENHETRLGEIERRNQAAIDKGQSERLQALEQETSRDMVDAELPGINTPKGAEQRLKLDVPTPKTLVTLGAIGNKDAEQHPVGPAGFSLHTVKNFAAEVHEHTIIDSDLNTILHTGKDWTGVAGEKINLSTNGDYQLGTVGGISISAAPNAGFTDPEFTVDPQMAVPDPPAIDTKGPRASTENAKTVWGTVWKAYDAYSGAKSLKTVIKDRKLAKGIAKDTFAGKAAGMYGLYSNGKKLYDAAMAAYDGAVAGFNHFWPPEKPSGPGKPKLTIYAEDGVTMMTPAKVSIFSTWGGVSVESPHKVGVKAGVSASMKAGCDASVFAFVSAKLESKGLASVKGKVVSVSGDLTEVIGKKMAIISSEEKVGVESDNLVRVSSPKKVQVAGKDVHINAEREVYMASDDAVTARAEKVATVWGTEQIYAGSDTEILLTIKGKQTDLKLTDGEVDITCGDAGILIDKSEAMITGKSASATFGTAFKIEGSAGSKIKAPKIDLG